MFPNDFLPKLKTANGNNVNIVLDLALKKNIAYAYFFLLI